MTYVVRYCRPGGNYRAVVVRGAYDARHAQDAVELAHSLCAATDIRVDKAASEAPMFGAEEIRVGGAAPAPVMPRLPARVAGRRVAA